MKYGFILLGNPAEIVELAQEAEDAGWDGAVIGGSPEELRERKTAIEALRTNPLPLDIITEGETPHDDPESAAAIVRPYAEAGATWWLESMWEGVARPYDMRTRIRSGPPRIE